MRSRRCSPTRCNCRPACAHPQIKAGAIKGLAVTGEKRWHDLLDIPTMIESGYEDFVFDTYTALMATAKTPAEAVAFLENEVLAALSKPELRRKLTDAGFEVTARNGEGHMARIHKEVPMFKKIIAEAGIKLGS
jgi:tripartite-type tricarboxylate transporter receptor subunit TctC